MKTPCFVIALFMVTLLSCKKQPVDQLSLLPPATQTGANTFGCLVNGRAFLPKKGLFSHTDLECFYVDTKRGYVFNIGASRDLGDGSGDDIGIAQTV